MERSSASPSPTESFDAGVGFKTSLLRLVFPGATALPQIAELRQLLEPAAAYVGHARR
jgi:hypothetical protein